ncbi:hypothetical protein QC764_402210 [Podospora pseudoanserina]|uniref:NAD-dependent epimerase/dehydratase domain-containing protein n=1 Tax=Podospora pseudoanserina TaxID=2609844 RepID=A0ABR0I8Z7_9PEZI|nr:hypothetical protein QC764_402210 [Podospora pseudoanserina]
MWPGDSIDNLPVQPPSGLDDMDNDHYADSVSSSSPSDSPAASSPLTSPDLSEDGFDIDRSPSPLGGREQEAGSPKFTLVIGGLGYIGSHTVLELLREGHNVIIVDNLSNSYQTILDSIKTLTAKHCKANGRRMPLIHFHRLDYRSRSMRFLIESYTDLVMSIDGSGRQRMTYQSRIEGVIHFAAYKSVEESIRRPLQYYQNNVCGLVSLLQQLDKYNIHNFIFSSSATVYGSKANTGEPLRESDLIHHAEERVDESTGERIVTQPSAVGLSCPYARTKYFSEAILADVAAANPAWRIVALRYFNPVGCDPSGLLGENPRGEATNLYPVLTQVLTGQRERLNVFGTDWATRDGTAVRDYIHVLDVARGHISALGWNGDRGGTGFRAFNLGSGTGTTVLEAVRSLEAASKRTVSLDWAGRRPGDVGVCVASTERASKELGWSPRESVAQCASDLWNFVERTLGLQQQQQQQQQSVKV